jgi:hypothetical protein
MPRRLLSALLGAALLAVGAPVLAFDFHEHSELTVDGARELPDEARVTLRRALGELRRAPRPVPPLPLCDDPLASLGTGRARGCVPYGSLTSIAADHHPTEASLLASLATGQVRALIAGAATAQRELEAHLARIDPDDGEAIAQARSDALRSLDLYQTVQNGWFGDQGYVALSSRGASHFAAGDGALERQLVLLVSEGRVDRALGQALVHHLRSLQLAREWRRRKQPWILAHAFAAHAFALHFIQDAHAAGHAVTRSEDFFVADSRMRRHDYFGFRGVGMTFALAEGPCVAGAEHAAGAEGPCWTAFGDGNLGPPRSIDREHAAASTRVAQLELALALEPEIAESWTRARACPAGTVDGTVAGEEIALCSLPTGGLAIAARLLDPHPFWTFPTGAEEPRGHRGCLRAALIVEQTLSAIATLDGPHRIPSITTDAPDETSGATPVRGVVTAGEIGTPTLRCIATRPGRPLGPMDPAVDAICISAGRSRAVLGSIGTSVIRPLLARWPVTQALADTLTGEAGNGRGLGWQVAVGGQIAHTLDGDATLRSYVGLGIAPRFQDLFAQAPSFAPIEVNVGFGPTLLVPRDTRADDTIGFALFGEVRAPVVGLLPAALWSLGASDAAPTWLAQITIGPQSFRAGWDLERDAFAWDVEVASTRVPFGSTFLPYRADLVPAELRLRIGRDHGLHAWTFALELAGGVTGIFDDF